MHLVNKQHSQPLPAWAKSPHRYKLFMSGKCCTAALMSSSWLRVVYHTLTDCSALQTVNAGLDLWDFMPIDLFMAETIQSESDLDDIMVSICLSLLYSTYVALHCTPWYHMLEQNHLLTSHLHLHACCQRLHTSPSAVTFASLLHDSTSRLVPNLSLVL